ncbi:MAG: hypothetical protein M3305_04230 [Actinomycetota bacterium]|nr:hypothetical protein [Actinomycetota bacterium]
MSPRLAGMIDALTGNEFPADQRPAKAFDGLEFWQGHKQAEENRLRGGRARACPPVHVLSRSTTGEKG